MSVCEGAAQRFTPVPPLRGTGTARLQHLAESFLEIAQEGLPQVGGEEA